MGRTGCYRLPSLCHTQLLLTGQRFENCEAVKLCRTFKGCGRYAIAHGLNRGLKECKESITVLTVLKLTNMPHLHNKI